MSNNSIADILSSNLIANILIAIFILGFCCLIYFGYNIWQEAEDSAYQSCIASVYSEIYKTEATKDLTIENKDWKILSQEEVNSLMSKVHGGDCGKYNNQTLDIWNRKINIALKKPTDRIEIIIWSNGRDGISGTEDDLVIPYGEKVPNN
jgi:hypothetical protein